MMNRKQSRICYFALGVLLLGAAAGRADEWPGWLGPRRDGVWRETGILEKFPRGGAKVVWREPIDPGFTGPAIAGGRLYVTDRQGPKLKKGAEVSGKDGLKGTERILCRNAKDGKLIWKHEYETTYTILYPSGPRATPIVHDGKVYTLGAMGDLFCLDAESGKVQWSKNLGQEYKTKPPLWGWSAHPLIEGNKLICLVGGDKSVVVAFDKDSGKEIWHALTAQEIGYAPPVICEAAGKRQLIVFHPESVNSLDPATGSLYWTIPFPSDGKPNRPGITIAMPRQQGNHLFVTSAHHGSIMLKLAADKPGATVVWQGKSSNIAKSEGLHAIMSTPIWKDGFIYGVCAFGELRCLNAKTGARIWESYKPVADEKAIFATAFLVAHEDRFFIFNDQGDLIIAKLTPKGYEEVDRAHLLAPTLFSRGRDVVWSHPAFADRCLYVRNDKEIICVSLAAEQKT